MIKASYKLETLCFFLYDKQQKITKKIKKIKAIIKDYERLLKAVIKIHSKRCH